MLLSVHNLQIRFDTGADRVIVRSLTGTTIIVPIDITRTVVVQVSRGAWMLVVLFALISDAARFPAFRIDN